jgi:hypothetical protein
MYFECGALAFIPDNSEPDTDRESDAMTYTGVHCLDVIFKWGDFDLIYYVIQSYIYVRVYLFHTKALFVKPDSISNFMTDQAEKDDFCAITAKNADQKRFFSNFVGLAP